MNLSDCSTGPSELEAHCLLDMGLSKQDVLDLTAGWKQTQGAAMRAIAQAGGWVWQMFSGRIWGNGAGGALPPSMDKGAACQKAYTAACSPTSLQQTRMSYHELRLKDLLAPGSIIDAVQDVARFLVIRGPMAFLGTAWVGCAPNNGTEAGGHNMTYVRPVNHTLCII